MAVVKLLQAHPGGTGPLVVGETCFGKLEVRALLGKGGHAWVYECFDRFLQRPVAVKVIKTLHEAGRDLSRRAQSEAQVLAGLEHPNLVRMLDAGIHGGLVYIVMEKLEGRTLRHALMTLSRLSIPETLRLAIQVADGMQLAHDHGVIHRDLKPENLFITAENHLKVLDFGVAKVLGASHVTTQRDRLQGTFLYMSPEQLQGVAVTPASDVFALGTMMFEMLYGHPLLLGGEELPSNEHVAWMQLHDVPPPLEKLDARIPRYVGKLIGRAIVKLPSDRFQTMRELGKAAAEALHRYEREQGGDQDAPRARDLSRAAPRDAVAAPRKPEAPRLTVVTDAAAKPPSNKAKAPKKRAPATALRSSLAVLLLSAICALYIASAFRMNRSPSPTASSVHRPVATRLPAMPHEPPQRSKPRPAPSPLSTSPSPSRLISAPAAPTRRSTPQPPSADTKPPDVPHARLLPAATKPAPARPRETIF